MLVLAIPAVQNYLGTKATIYIQKAYDLDLHIDKISMSYLGNIQLDHILVKDHHCNEMLYVQSMRSSLQSIPSVLRGDWNFDSLTIDSLRFQIQTYKNENQDNLRVLLRKFDMDSAHKKPKTSRFNLTNIRLNQGNFRWIDQNLTTAKVLDYRNIQLQLQQLLVDGKSTYLDVNSLAFRDQNGLKVERLSSCMVFGPEALLFQELEIKTRESELIGQIQLKYKHGDFNDFVNRVKLQANFEQSRISTNDLVSFYPGFGRDQKIYIDRASLSGTLNNLQLQNTKLRTQNATKIIGKIRLRNAISNSKRFKLQGDFKTLKTNYNELIDLLPNVLKKYLPKQLASLGTIRGKGNVIVTPQTVDLDMRLHSRFGVVDAFVLLDQLHTPEKSTFNGNLISKDFDLGALLLRKSLGKTTFNIDIDGQGFDFGSLDAKIEGDLQRLAFNNYDYSNLQVLGRLQNEHFEGKLTVYDPNVKFSFNGIADLSKTLNDYDFVANVDHIDLKKLHFFTRDKISIFNGDVRIQVSGKNINDLQGTLAFEKTMYTNEEAGYYFEDFEINSQFDDQGVRTISINSPDSIEGSIVGIFKFENLYELFRNSMASLYSNFEPVSATDNEFMKFDLKIYNQIVAVFFPGLKFAPNTLIQGRVDSNDSVFKLRFKSPKISVFENEMQQVDIQFDTENPLFSSYIKIDSLHSSRYHISDFNMVNLTLNDTLYMKANFKGGKKNTDSYNLSLYHTIDQNNHSVVGFSKSNFVFKGYAWDINPTNASKKNKMIFDNRFQNIDIKSIVLSHKNEEISVSGLTRGRYYKDITLTFRDVDVFKITPEIKNLRLGGTIQGNLTFFQDEGNYFPSSTLNIKDFRINNTTMGTLRLNAKGNESLTEYRIDSHLTDQDGSKTFSAIGAIHAKDSIPIIDLAMHCNQLDISGLSDLGGIVISDLRGNVSGDIKLSNALSNPDLIGQLICQDVGLKVPYLNVDFDIDQQSKILIQKDRFVLDYFKITDVKYNTKGILGGFITHQNFSDWKLGLDLFAPNRLLVLDTKETEESLYYGTSFISGDAKIKGATDALVIDINAKTEAGTVFKIPLTDNEGLGDNSWIHFLNYKEKKARLEGRDLILKEVKGLDLNFDLDVTDDAEVEIMIDKKTGSSLKGRGAGTLLIEINTNGKFNMWGDFVAYQGSYNFRYGALLEKIFTVRPRGTITWDGSPTRAILDLSAVYRTEANPAVLLDNSNFSRKIPVEVVVDLQGELIQPDLGFHIEFPNLSSVVRSELEYQLDDQSTRELQALSLVTQGQFVNTLSVGQNVITGNLVERASSLVNDIFSDKDDKFKVGLSYIAGDRLQNQQNNDQFGVTVTTQIKDRILINGRVGVPVGRTSQSLVVGDIELGYLFNEEGTLRGKLFNRQNDIQYLAENQGYTQGVGISYSVDFNNLSELWTNIFKSKKIVDSIPATTIDSSAIQKPDFINFPSSQKNSSK